ncbi:MAG: WHG domain-containing protein [Nesterenkonia sp.]|nr:WHG domain-containing protein [Nesterenkonia sp.]
MARPRIYDQQVRTRLLTTASAAVAAGGEQAVSLRSLASEAGVTTAAVYSLFGGRRQLLDAVVEEGFRRFAAHLDAADRTDDPRADLLELGLAYREYALAEPDFYRVMFGTPRTDGVQPDSPATGRPTFAVLREAVARALGVGDRGHGPDPEVEALRLWGLAHGLVSLELAGLLEGDADSRRLRYMGALRSSSL